MDRVGAAWLAKTILGAGTVWTLRTGAGAAWVLRAVSCVWMQAQGGRQEKDDTILGAGAGTVRCLRRGPYRAQAHHGRQEPLPRRWGANNL